MMRHIIFVAIFTEVRRALADARRYESLKYRATGHDHFAPGEISRRIFEEFYASGPDFEDAAPAFASEASASENINAIRSYQAFGPSKRSIS